MFWMYVLWGVSISSGSTSGGSSTYIHTYIYSCIHVYIHIRIHAYMCTYLHTCILTVSSPSQSQCSESGRLERDNKVYYLHMELFEDFNSLTNYAPQGSYGPLFVAVLSDHIVLNTDVL